MKREIVLLAMFTMAIIFMAGCKQHGTPKPRGYYRIAFPEHDYKPFNKKSPYTFDLPVYTEVGDGAQPQTREKYWYNINYPNLNGILHISYKAVDNNLNEMLEDSRKLAYKHSVKADAIAERLFISADKNVYGTLFDIKGDAASPVQFYLTDSVRNFVRGSLYFNSVPNKDSLAPVIDFVKTDIVHLMETFEWKEMPKL
ncbi:gliding motility-associated lipoprotein GldD [Saccharicrinis carchari]|uniref:Gliding motility-associated lipoprotein GldD n=1 Tax=Saccharicrinis carchari TaxID=1168039 RepID=A0A521CE36_SACCC|nr:gliding motility lipoprotein GldD [Saccharicrinis carchari]SMO57662.1 gliding motility-associated lipoprotein GldD [Saccharicrinis carchari]